MHLPHVFPFPVTRLARLFRRLPRFHAFPSEAMAILVSLLVAVPATHAAGKDARVSVSIYCTAYADGLKSVFVKTAANRFESVGLSTANIVEAADLLVEDGRILLYGPAGEDGNRPVVAETEIGTIRQPLIVVNPPAKDAAKAYASKAVEVDPAKFPLGSFNLVNLSPNPVRIIHEKVTLELEGADSRIFTPDHAAGESFAVQMDYQTDGKWTLLSSARWAARDDRRTLVCFLLDPTSKRMNVKSVPLRASPKR